MSATLASRPQRSRLVVGAGSAVTGVPRLVRLAFRRDRIVLPAWLLGIGFIGSTSVAGVSRLYGTEAERLTAATFSADNPVARVFNGPAAGADLGALAFTESFMIVAMLVAVMALQTMIRHSRAEEEAGRAELVGSSATGRHARLLAGWAVAATSALAAGLLYTLVLLGQGVATSGSVAAGAACAGVGLVFASVGAVTAQLFGSPRTATGTGLAALAASFLLRALGDLAGTTSSDGTVVVSAWPSWLSPLGWAHQVRPFLDDRWWVVLLLVAASGALLVGATVVSARRDVGAGLIAARPGRAVAPRSLRGSVGLAWRLHRGTVLAWAAGLSVIGASFGAVGEGVEELVAENEQFAELLGAMSAGSSLTDTFFAFTMTLLGIAVGGYVVQALLRLRGEEAGGRLEPVLSSAVGRIRWMTSHLLVAVAGSATLLLAVGTSAAAVYVAASGAEPSAGLDIVGAALVQLPAAWLLGGLVVALFGLAPRLAAGVGWAAVAFCFVVAQLGDSLDLPQSVRNLSPFTHVPAVPAVDLELLPLVLLSAAAAVGTAIGLARFRRRDLAIGA